MIQATDRGVPPLSSTATVRISIKDVNDNAPIFNDTYYVEVAESASANRPLLTVYASDLDYDVNGLVQYFITSGNDFQNFAINRDTGLIYVQSSTLDYETRAVHHLTVSAIDSSVRYARQSSFVTVVINVTDVNEYTPRFPFLMYYESVMEKQPAGTSVFTAKATDLDAGVYGVITYSITSGEAKFSIDARSGVVRTREEFVYSPELEYNFEIRASDRDGLFSSLPVGVKIEPNFLPEFVERSYSFSVAGNAQRGDVVGQVQVRNADQTVSSGVSFSFKYRSDYFAIDSRSGIITVIRDLQQSDSSEDSARRRRRDVTLHLSRSRRAMTDNEVTLTIVASVGFPPQTSETDVVVMIDRDCNGCQVSGAAARSNNKGDSNNGMGTTTLVIIVVFVVIAIILGIVILALFIRGRTQRARKQKANAATRFDNFNGTTQTGLGPPPYNEASCYGHMNGHLSNSDLSQNSMATGSSGRGSAEVDIEEDEEIRMINATPMDGTDARLPADSGMQDDDAMSEHSVKDHQEYLARLGIDTSKLKINNSETANKAQSVESMHQFSDEGGGEGDGLDTLQYSAIPQQSMAVMESAPAEFGYQEPAEQTTGGSLSSVINSEEEFSGSYNWDYLLDWGPQYQPLAEVFTEIARLKDDSIKPKKAPTKIVPQMNGGFPPNQQQQRTSFPPPIITDAPPKSIQLGGQSNGPLHFSSQAARPYRERKDSSSSSMTVNSTRTSQLTSLSNLPKSPMSYESSFTTTPLSPDFENSLSPLQQHSPTFSPIVTPGVTPGVGSSTGHNTPYNNGNNRSASLAAGSSGSEQEIHI